MSLCRHGLCKVDVGDDGYCRPHGGRERLESEWAQKAARDEKRQTAGHVIRKEGVRPVVLDGTNRGVAAPGQGLSAWDRGTRPLIPGTNATKSRAEREAARKKRREERQALIDKMRGTSTSQQDEGGNGTSRKARQKAKKRHAGSTFHHGSSHGVAVKQKK